MSQVRAFEIVSAISLPRLSAKNSRMFITEAKYFRQNQRRCLRRLANASATACSQAWLSWSTINIAAW